MLLDEQTLMAAFCDHYRARDLAACAAFFTDDVVYAFYIDTELAPFGGVSIGRDVMMHRLAMIDDLFELLDYRLLGARQESDNLNASIAYHFRHKATGEDIAGTMRVNGQLRGQQLCRVNEYHDRARVEAFLRLVQNMQENATPVTRGNG